ncbi:hypothetical protein JCM5350_007558 [Sporobolomyces pararoseus]
MSVRDRIVTLPTSVPQVQIIYDFITPQEEAFLLQHIDQVGGASTSSSSSKNWGWKNLNGRRSMYWRGTILPNSHHLIPTPFPKFMEGTWPDILDRIAQTGVYDQWTVEPGKEKGKGKERGPNHCLVNEYLPSQGILPHTDGPAYQPCTTTFSLSSHTILSLRSNPRPSSSSSTSTPSSTLTTPTTATTTKTDPEQLESSSNPESQGLTLENEKIEKIEIFLPPRSLLILTSTLYSDYLHGIQPLGVSPVSSLIKCVNWEGWWEYLIETGEIGGEGDREKFESIFKGQDLEVGEEEDQKREQEKRAVVEDQERKREEAFGELKKGLKELNLLSEPTELEGGDVTSTLNSRDEPFQSKDTAITSGEEGGGAKIDWENLVKTQKRKIENFQGPEFVNGWKRGKRISLTCRRNAGKVKDLGGLLSRVGGKK